MTSAQRGQAPFAGPFSAVFDPPIVIKDAVHRYHETPFNLISGSTALAHHFFLSPAIGISRHVLWLGSAGLGRNICAN